MIVFLLSSCAQIVSPTGGPVDRDAPKIESMSFKDSSLYFRPSQLVFRFDEVIQSKNPNEIVSFSPFTREDVKTKVNYKELILEIPKGALRDSTTYSLNLDGVQDANEGNKMESKSFIFSTGAFLDSMYIEGKILPSSPKVQNENFKVYLYSADDSFGILKAQKPLFFSEVSSSGSFKVSSLPKGRYRLYALDDKNKNYRYDLPAEVIAFDTTTITLNDTSIQDLLLFSFAKQYPEVEKNQNQRNSSKGGRSGTKSRGASAVPLNSALVWTFDTNATVASVDIFRPLEISSNFPIINFDPELISLTDTTDRNIQELSTRLDSLKKTISIVPISGFKSDHVYKLFIKEDAIEDSSGWKNNREVLYFRTNNADEYSSVRIQFKAWDSTQQYVLHIESTQLDTFVVQAPYQSTDIFVDHLLPGEVSLSYFIDLDKNGEYTNGDFDQKLQPEIVQVWPEKLELRKSWDHIYKIEATDPKLKVGKTSGNLNRAGTSN